LDQKDLPVKSTEDPLIGIRKPIVFLYGYKRSVARNLLTYRYNQLDKAIENAQNNLGFKTDCPLSNGYHEWGECHNEWEITHEEIHRNGAIAFAIF
jgi:trehalose/maltose hydrolase-like predicted phosphorylase